MIKDNNNPEFIINAHSSTFSGIVILNDNYSNPNKLLYGMVMMHYQKSNTTIIIITNIMVYASLKLQSYDDVYCLIQRQWYIFRSKYYLQWITCSIYRK